MQFATAIGEHYQRMIGAGPDGANALLQGIAVNRTHGTMLVKASKEGRKALRLGEAAIARHVKSGRDLPQLRNVKTGRLIETFKSVPQKAVKAAELSALVVSVAHVISGMDIANKLSEVDRKLNRLVQGRRIDQLAKLEQIYRAARERLSQELSPADVAALHAYREELLCLRATWRREFEQVLASAPDPRKVGIFERRVTAERKVGDEILGAADRVRLLKLSLLLDMCLAEVTNTLDGFIARTVPDELKLLEATARQLEAVCTRIENQEVRRCTKDVQEAVSGLTQMLFGLNAAVVPCPACDLGLRVPGGRTLQITCPSCRTSFERET